MSKKLKFLTLTSALALSTVAHAGDVKVEVLDKSFNPAGGFLAYTEFELSGEPLAESLGLDLDVLDPALLNQPTAFDLPQGLKHTNIQKKQCMRSITNRKWAPILLMALLTHVVAEHSQLWVNGLLGLQARFHFRSKKSH